MPSEIVDGMDPEAVYNSVQAAVGRAREGKGPTLIEAKTYRFRGHYEGDSQSYRTTEELESWRKRDPIVAYRRRLLDSGVCEDLLEQILAQAGKEVEVAAEAAQRGSIPSRDRIFEQIYAN